jgi:CDP-paratose 2-epimerase
MDQQKKNLNFIQETCSSNYTHHSIDIRDQKSIEDLFKEVLPDAIIHTAAQPSHDWASKEPLTDFSINATGTLNLLEASRKFSKDSPFVFLSTNKVYGDLPNSLPLNIKKNRFELSETHSLYNGINESMSIDQSTHSLFGVSKASADLLVQEYGRYFGMPTVCFRGGCLTGAFHSGVELHGFLNYLVKCVMKEKNYTVYGHNGMQVRDNIASYDLLTAINLFIESPKVAQVYNIGGGRRNSISILEAIESIEEKSNKKAKVTFSDKARIGDHLWYISDVSKFKSDYPSWDYKHNLDSIISNIIEAVSCE